MKFLRHEFPQMPPPFRTLLALVAAPVFVLSCGQFLPPVPEENSLLDGPIEGLSMELQAQFFNGDEAFGEVFTASNGLGPIFVASQCASCHPGDGKGAPFVKFTRFGQPGPGENLYLDQGGPQLQHKALPGYSPEVLPMGASWTDLIAPAVTGLGFLDAVSDEDLIALADPDDLDGDGISGRPHWNRIPSYVQLRPLSVEYPAEAGMYISRFGKKGAAYDLLHQTAVAYNQDMGITSLFEPIDVYSGLEIDPEVATQTVHDVVGYLKTLKAPIQRNPEAAEVLAGGEVFGAIDCAACHTPVMMTASSPIEQLDHVEFYPYTDQLLHDMGPGLDDGYTEGYATTAEWKTPALWGLGLSRDAQGGQYFLLHDGRAHSLEEAIALHGGEAQASAEAFDALPAGDKAALITFLESL
jgi:CxxC motif-containing protein (DUF1111 family)